MNKIQQYLKTIFGILFVIYLILAPSGVTIVLKSGENAPDPRALLAKHDEQRKRAEQEAKPSQIILKPTDKEQ